MKITRYRDCTYEELIEAEKELMKKQRWLRSGSNMSKFPYWKHYQPGAGQLNNSWQIPSYWHVPKSYVKSKFKGGYEISIHIRDNEEFDKYCKGEEIRKAVKDLMKEKKLTLQKKVLNTRKNLDALNDEFSNKLNDLKSHLIIFIKKNGIEVKKYEPHFFGSEDGRNTQKMLSLIENAELAFRGIMCGSIYAYECLIGNYFTEEETIDDLWESTSKILVESKEYLALQIALEYYKGPSTKRKWDYAKPIVKSLLADINKLNHVSDQELIEIFKKHCPGFTPEVNYNYVTLDEKLIKKNVGHALAKICTAIDPQNIPSIKGDTIKRKVDDEVYPNDDLTCKFWD